MRVYKDKATGKYKSGSNSSVLYDTKEQCQRAYLDELAERLSNIRRNIEKGAIGYGR